MLKTDLKTTARLFFFLFAVISLSSLINKDPEIYEGFNLKTFEKSLSYIPKGTFIFGIDLSYTDGVCLNCEKHKKISLDSFYISKYEVSNGQYLEFVNDIFKTDSNLYKKLLPDTLVWRTKLFFNEPYVEYYFRHPAYRSYPVVGLNYEKANTYCVWLTKKYIKESKRKYKNMVLKLPTQEQWECAAKGGLSISYLPWVALIFKIKKGNG